MFSSTGALFQYFSPSQSRRVEMLCLVTGSMGAAGSDDVGCDSNGCAGGGVGPPRTTVERNPEFCMASMSLRWNLVSGIEVSPSRAREAFCKCEHVLAKWTKDMMRDSHAHSGP